MNPIPTKPSNRTLPAVWLVLVLGLAAGGCSHADPSPVAPAAPEESPTTPPKPRPAPTRSLVRAGPEGTEIVPAEAWIYACLDCEGIPYAEMGDAIARARSLLKEQKIAPAGACRVVYRDDPREVDAARLRYQVGFPVTPESLPMKPLRRVPMPAALIARALHRGDYDEAFQLRYYERIPAALRKSGFEPAGPIIEIYRYALDEQDPSRWTTEIQYPIRPRGTGAAGEDSGARPAADPRPTEGRG